jgi:hypothetical protein
MPADRDDAPVPRPREAQEIELEVMDDSAPAAGAPDTVSIQDFMKAGPEMVSGFLKAMMMEKLKKWFVRNLVVFTVLALLTIEYKWAIPLLYIWGIIAGLQLAVIAFVWYMGNKQASMLTRVMKGMPGGRRE